MLLAAPAEAIPGGQPDDGADPQVGMILAPVGGGSFYFCSGTLIAPAVVLTAGHCTSLFADL